jgi:hypothetical protein
MRLERVIRFSAILRRLLSKKPKRDFRLLTFALAVCVFSVLVYTSVSVYLFSTTIGSRGTVRTLGVGVYWDEICSNSVSYIDWGIVDPGSQENVAVYVRNEGNVPASILLDTVDWDPPKASSYITLSWDYSGQLVEPDDSIRVTLTLLISPSIQNVASFDFDIVIAEIR